MWRAALVASILACSREQAVPPTTAEALLGGASADTPWPSDVILVDGRLHVHDLPLPGSPGSLGDLEAALSELDGAPVQSSIFFPVRGGSIPDGKLSDTAQLVDLDSGATRELSLFHRTSTSELVALAPTDGVLAEGHRYACIVGDRYVHPSEEMRRALAGEGPYAASYAKIAGRANVGAATVFTVGHPTRVLATMRSSLDAMPPPKASVLSTRTGAELDRLFGVPTTTRSGIGDPEGVVHDAIGAVVFGSYEAPWYLGASTASLGHIELDGTGTPIAKATVTIPFLLTLPKGAGPKTPILIFQHGLNASRVQVLAVANDYARAGYATIGIDALWHGARRPGARDEKHAFGKESGPDGLADDTDFGASTVFFAFDGDPAAGIRPLDARAVRDNFRQAVVEIGQLVRLLKHGDLAAVAASDPSLAGVTLDASALVYTGESFGSLLGAMVIAVDTELHAAVLAVPGASIFLTMFPNSPLFSGLATLLLRGPFDSELDVSDPNALPAGAQRSLSLIQGAIEPGDPIAFAPRVAPRTVLLLQAFSDEVIPNQAGELLAAAMGASQVEVAGHTQPLRYVPLPKSSSPTKGVTVMNVDPATHVMYTRFSDKRSYEIGFPPALPLSPPQVVDEPIEWLHATALGFADAYRKTGG
jgi:hypothetical protein